MIARLLRDNGKFIAQEIETNKLLAKNSVQIGTRENPIGMTIFERGTGNPICVYAEGGILKTTAGECGAEALASAGAAGTVDALTLPDNTATTTPSAEVAPPPIPTPPMESTGQAEGVGTPTSPEASVGAATSTPPTKPSETPTTIEAIPTEITLPTATTEPAP